MTIYLTYEALENKELDLQEEIELPYLNDAAEALGNRIVEKGQFTEKMNEKAKELNLSEETKFTSASGLQTEKGDSKSNTKDLVVLVRALLTKYPEVLKQTSSKIRKLGSGETIYSTNDLLKNKNKKDFRVDGLKTGYTEDAGYCFIGTAKKENRSLIVIVLGANTSEERFFKAEKLLVKYFD